MFGRYCRISKSSCTLQMFAGNCRDSAGVFCNICRENPVIYTDFPCNPCNPVNITGFSLQILQKTPCRVPAIPCKHLQCTYILSTYLKSILFLEMFELEIVILMHSGLKQVGKTTDLKWAEFYHSPLPVQIGLKVHFVLFCCLKQNRTK